MINEKKNETKVTQILNIKKYLVKYTENKTKIEPKQIFGVNTTHVTNQM